MKVHNLGIGRILQWAGSHIQKQKEKLPMSSPTGTPVPNPTPTPMPTPPPADPQVASINAVLDQLNQFRDDGKARAQQAESDLATAQAAERKAAVEDAKQKAYVDAMNQAITTLEAERAAFLGGSGGNASGSTASTSDGSSRGAGEHFGEFRDGFDANASPQPGTSRRK